MSVLIKKSDLALAGRLRKLRPAFIASFLKKILLPNRFVHQSKYGTFYVDIASDFGLVLASDREYEPYMRQTLEHYLSKDSVFIDLGANEGCFTVLASKLVGPNGKIFSIEPQSRLQPIINKNLELNSCSNVIVDQLAISDKLGEASMYITPDINTGCSGMTRVSKYPVPTEKIKTTTLQEYFIQKNIKSVSLIKIDVEGWEYEAILGSKQLFKNRLIQNIALELHPEILSKRNRDINEIHDFLIECGYILNHPFGYRVYEMAR